MRAFDRGDGARRGSEAILASPFPSLRAERSNPKIVTAADLPNDLNQSNLCNTICHYDCRYLIQQTPRSLDCFAPLAMTPKDDAAPYPFLPAIFASSRMICSVPSSRSAVSSKSPITTMRRIVLGRLGTGTPSTIRLRTVVAAWAMQTWTG